MRLGSSSPVSVSRSADAVFVLSSRVETPAHPVTTHPDSNQDMSEVGGTAGDAPASTLFIFINIVKNVGSKLLRMSMSAYDDIVRSVLFKMFVEIVESSHYGVACK